MSGEKQAVVVIGVGADGAASLTAQALKYIEEAHQLWGSSRLLQLWQHLPLEKVALSENIRGQVETLKDRLPGQRIVLLASGDPGFFGLGSIVMQTLPPHEVLCLPQVTSLQLAFARAAVAWGGAVFSSAHALPVAEICSLAKRFSRLGILTDGHNKPGSIAAALLAAGVDDCRTVVAENLGLPDERLVDTRLSQLPLQDFAPLNVLLVLQDEDWKPAATLLLRPDERYAHRSGMITKHDVRVLAYARLEIHPTDVVWDIGAGSGAMSVEMAELAWKGQIFSVERDAAQVGYLQENLQRFGALNVQLVAGEAPAALTGLPQPDAVFIGGSGGRMEEILDCVASRGLPGCRVVSHHVTLENLLAAQQKMKKMGWQPQFVQVSLAQGMSIGENSRLVPANPVFILSGMLEHHRNVSL